MKTHWVKIALAASLAINLFIIGIAVGAMGQHHRMNDMRKRPMGGNPIMRLSEQLPPDKQQAFRQAMRQAMEANRGQAETSRAARQKLIEVFSAQTFDAAAASQALAAVRNAETTGRTAMENTMVEFAKTLTPEERKALAQNLSRPFGGRGPNRGPGRDMAGPRGMEGGPGGPGPDGPDGSPPVDAPPLTRHP